MSVFYTTEMDLNTKLLGLLLTFLLLLTIEGQKSGKSFSLYYNTGSYQLTFGNMGAATSATKLPKQRFLIYNYPDDTERIIRQRTIDSISYSMALSSLVIEISDDVCVHFS